LLQRFNPKWGCKNPVGFDFRTAFHLTLSPSPWWVAVLFAKERVTFSVFVGFGGSNLRYDKKQYDIFSWLLIFYIAS